MEAALGHADLARMFHPLCEHGRLLPQIPRLDPSSPAGRAPWTPHFTSKEAEVRSASETCRLQSCPDGEASLGFGLPTVLGGP